MTDRHDNTIGGSSSLDGWLAIGLVILGLGTAVVALLGPLATEVIRYHASDAAINQIAGGDMAGLVLVAPISVIAGILVWRRNRAGRVLALGPAVYALYVNAQLSLGGDVTRYPGNSERFFPLYLGLFVLAGAIAIRAWTGVDPTALPATQRRIGRVLGWYAIVVSVFLVVGLHVPGLIDAWRDHPTSTEYLADPVVFWLVKMMDLGLVVPALMATGVAALRGRGGLDRAGYAAAGWMALLGTSVAGMAVVMQATDDPAATTANTVAFTLFALIGLAIAAVVYRPLLASGPSASKPDTACDRRLSKGGADA
ncbi:MAG: hypothetical protein WBV06_11500 [Acidimicrobiia bacterium]